MLAIRKFRKERNMTQGELGEKLGVTASAVTMWESGSREPNLSMVKKIANVFNCKVDDLFPEENFDKAE